MLHSTSSSSSRRHELNNTPSKRKEPKKRIWARAIRLRSRASSLRLLPLLRSSAAPPLRRLQPVSVAVVHPGLLLGSTRVCFSGPSWPSFLEGFADRFPHPGQVKCYIKHVVKLLKITGRSIDSMGLEEQDVQPDGGGKPDATKKPAPDNDHKPRVSSCSTDKDYGLSLCRVCHCAEPDLRGESALGFLGIVPPSPDPSLCADKDSSNDATKTSTSKDGSVDAPAFLEFISPEGEIFVCATDVESGPLHRQDDVVNLGCSCKNELALAHYACALKWFVSHGSTVCEICGNVAANIRPEDFNKVLASLKDYEALRERTSTGELSYLHYSADASVDPVALAAVRRQRLCEISSWFNPHNTHVVFSQRYNEEPPVSPSNISVEHGVMVARAAHARRSLGGTGAFVTVALGFVLLAWFVAPHVGKKAAAICLHMLLGGLCSLTIIISLRFVFPRVQFGSMRCWAILFVSWFLVFGVWASRTRNVRSS